MQKDMINNKDIFENLILLVVRFIILKRKII